MKYLTVLQPRNLQPSSPRDFWEFSGLSGASCSEEQRALRGQCASWGSHPGCLARGCAPSHGRAPEQLRSLHPCCLDGCAQKEGEKTAFIPTWGVGSEDVCARGSTSQILFLSKGSTRRERKAFPKRSSREKGASPQRWLAGWGNQWKEVLWRLGEWTVKTEKVKMTGFKKKKEGKYKLKFKHQVFSVSQV